MVENDQVSAEPQPLTFTETAGNVLSSARIGWKLSLEDVAGNLNLSVDTISALEKDEYSQLPGYTFVKGYIRSYAKLLELNPDDVIARVLLEPEQLAEIPSVKSSIKLKSKPLRKKNRPLGKIFRVLMVTLLLIGLGLFGLNQFSKLDKDKLASILKLPSSGSKGDVNDSNEIVFPVTQSPDEKKEALIRIE